MAIACKYVLSVWATFCIFYLVCVLRVPLQPHLHVQILLQLLNLLQVIDHGLVELGQAGLLLLLGPSQLVLQLGLLRLESGDPGLEKVLWIRILLEARIQDVNLTYWGFHEKGTHNSYLCT